jgi:hypothetical protein
MTTQQFLDTHRITMRASTTHANPHISGMPHGTRHYRCLFRKDGRRMTVVFSMGPAYHEPPTAVHVLDCLASDAAGFKDWSTFEGFCAEYGYDEDNRKAERTYKAVEKQTTKLRVFLSDDTAYKTLLYDTERA